MKNSLTALTKRQFDKVRNKYVVLPVICLAAFLCCGCGVSASQENMAENPNKTAAKLVTMENTPVVDYPVPQLTPNILVDLAGYRVEGKKSAAVKGRKVPKRFSLVDADNGETVFTGTLLDEEYNAELDCYTVIADFSDWTQEGRYYLECEHVGRSYPFTIEEGLYDRMFAEICAEKFRACDERTISLPDVAELLLAYEWYPDIFADENNNQTPDVLEKIAAWIGATASDNIAAGQEAIYAGTLAKFSYLYQKFDRQYATDCLKRASVVYEQTQTTLQKDAECFYALAELFRATGLYTYNSQIVEYKTYFKNHTNFTEETGYLYGGMTYVATRQSVDVELCTIFMSSIMAEAEELSDVYREMLHPVNARNNGAEDLLRHAEDIACANYVMNNYQYNQIMEQFLQYLRGKNQQSVDFYAEGAEEKPRGHLLLVAQITAVQDLLDE